MFPCFSFQPRSSSFCSHPSLMAPSLPVVTFQTVRSPYVGFSIRKQNMRENYMTKQN
jgi:hypothetical protein